MCCGNVNSGVFEALLDNYAELFLIEMLGDSDMRKDSDFAQLGRQAYKLAGNVMKARAQVLNKFNVNGAVDSE